jgi:hypothetical protein
MIRTLFVAIVAALLATPAAAQCLKSNADDQAATGRLTIGRGKDATGKVERPYILRLVKNACMVGETADDKVNRTRTIHVYPKDDKLHARFKKLVGKNVRVRGRPFPAHTAHHHAPIVIEVVEITGR